ncbi:hypothetical protein M8J77_002213 [Diaphorina citri]|nr:hypothetical protein M8J77_002213 [Diaphorina citri]
MCMERENDDEAKAKVQDEWEEGEEEREGMKSNSRFTVWSRMMLRFRRRRMMKKGIEELIPTELTIETKGYQLL